MPVKYVFRPISEATIAGRIQEYWANKILDLNMKSPKDRALVEKIDAVLQPILDPRRGHPWDDRIKKARERDVIDEAIRLHPQDPNAAIEFVRTRLVKSTRKEPLGCYKADTIRSKMRKLHPGFI